MAQRRATMKDVASAAGVSVMTVSRVVNNIPTVDPDLAKRVREVAKRLAFEPNGVARDLRSGVEQSTIGLVIEDLANPFYSALAKGVEEIARSHEALLITASSEENSDRERDVILELCRRRVAGLIVVPAAGSHRYLNDQIELGTPIVSVDRPLPDVQADSVLIDNFGGAVAGTQRLIAAGHKRIAVLGFTEETYTVSERLRGVSFAMQEAGLKLDPNLVRLGALKEEQAAAEVASLLEIADPPTALFCCNNRMTVGAIDEVDRRGVAIDIVGFDEVAFGNFLPVPVTFITYDVEQLARRAAELLFKRIDGYVGPARTTTLRTVLVTRGRRR